MYITTYLIRVHLLYGRRNERLRGHRKNYGIQIYDMDEVLKLESYMRFHTCEHVAKPVKSSHHIR